MRENTYTIGHFAEFWHVSTWQMRRLLIEGVIVGQRLPRGRWTFSPAQISAAEKVLAANGFERREMATAG